eukprot:m.135127 g.135127  ORF g.135127 m.135127 type:complete len:65 (-) comp13972_c1_seq3:6862-7056(-)
MMANRNSIRASPKGEMQEREHYGVMKIIGTIAHAHTFDHDIVPTIQVKKLPLDSITIIRKKVTL